MAIIASCTSILEIIGFAIKRIKDEIVEQSKRYWERSTWTSFLTFLASKLAGINTSNVVHIGQQEDERFINKFLTKDGKYYNPCSNKNPENPSEWFKTINQYRNKPEKPFSKAFNSRRRGFYKFSQNYIWIAKEHAFKGTSKGKKVSLFNVLIWLYRNTNFDDTEKLVDLKKQFITEFNFTEEELGLLFDDDIANFQNIFDAEVSSISIPEDKPISYPETPFTADINDPLETVRIQSTIYRVPRDTQLTRKIKSLHNYQCQICGAIIELVNGERYAEVHHIIPLGSSHNGPDVEGNMICVCPNHHVQLDYFSIALDKSKLRLNSNHDISEECLSYYNKKYYENISALRN